MAADGDLGRRWRDSPLFNWRIKAHLCVRWIPGPWFPMIWWNKRERYMVLALPGLAVAIDYL